MNKLQIILDEANKPFDRKTNMCFQSALRAWERINNTEIVLPEIKSITAGYRYLKGVGGWDAIADKEGLLKVESTYAQIGDLVVYPQKTKSGKVQDALGVCVGAFAVFAGGEKQRLKDCKAAYRKVGE